jgi:hypothetical protein
LFWQVTDSANIFFKELVYRISDYTLFKVVTAFEDNFPERKRIMAPAAGWDGQNFIQSTDNQAGDKILEGHQVGTWFWFVLPCLYNNRKLMALPDPFGQREHTGILLS